MAGAETNVTHPNELFHRNERVKALVPWLLRALPEGLTSKTVGPHLAAMSADGWRAVTLLADLKKPPSEKTKQACIAMIAADYEASERAPCAWDCPTDDELVDEPFNTATDWELPEEPMEMRAGL